jgi:hypothetical protein
MGRLAWLFALGSGPLLAAALVVHQRAPLAAALSEADHARAASQLREEQVALARAEDLCEQSNCSLKERGLIELALARNLEGANHLKAARSSFSTAEWWLRDARATAEAHREAEEGLSRMDRTMAALAASVRAEQPKAVEAPAEKVAPEVLLTRAETALTDHDASAARTALGEVEPSKLESDLPFKVRFLRASGRTHALAGDPAAAGNAYGEALHLELRHLDAAWPDPPATLRLWAEAARGTPAPQLMERLLDAETACTSARGQDSLLTARVNLVRGEVMLSRGDEAGAAPVLYEALNWVTRENNPDSAHATRDLLDLGQVEVRAGHYDFASWHLRAGAARLEQERAPLQQRLDAWRGLASFWTDHPWRKEAPQEALSALQSALDAAHSALDLNDPELLRAHLDVARAKGRVGDREGAAVEVGLVLKASPGGLPPGLTSEMNEVMKSLAGPAPEPAPALPAHKPHRPR